MSDALAPFGQAVLAVRWGTAAISLGLASAEIQDGDATVLAGVALLLAYTTFRTLRPIRAVGPGGGIVAISVEAALVAGLVVTSDYWASPFVFAMLTAAAIGGFTRGFGLGSLVAVGSVLVVSVPWLVAEGHEGGNLRTAAEWSAEVLLVALVAGYARRISGEADLRREVALDRLGRLSDANVLLFQLHQVTQTLPASLDLTEALDATIDQLRELFDADTATILLHEEADGVWYVVRQHGGPASAGLGATDLPAPVARTVALASPTHEHDLRTAGPGLDRTSGSGLYAVLTARGAVIGVIALEHTQPDHFTDRDLELLSGFVDPAALAIDNARWFARLRTVGADEERTRIARDLHDRTGQSLAYLAFELDRIAKQAAAGKDVTQPLDALRGDVRTVVGEVRDTLYDLRTDVTPTDGLVSTLGAFLDRVESRSGLRTHLDVDESGRLPLLREREVWRIAREAVTNVERHAQATRIDVRWRCDGVAAVLEVSDDGVGLATSAGGSLGSHGLAGMRERAAGIGAALAVEAEPGQGTRVRCTIAARS